MWRELPAVALNIIAKLTKTTQIWIWLCNNCLICECVANYLIRLSLKSVEWALTTTRVTQVVQSCKPGFEDFSNLWRFLRIFVVSKGENKASHRRWKGCPQFSVPSPQSQVLSPQLWILSYQSSVLSPRSSVLNPKSWILNPESSVLSRPTALHFCCKKCPPPQKKPPLKTWFTVF